jgi:hypothetical protein
MRDTNLVNALREHAEWAQANEWETPITLGDDLTEAADRIEAQAKEIEKLREQLRQLCRNCDLERLEELAKADKDGQLIMLPCKEGDTIHHISKVRTSHFEDDKIIIDDEGRWKIYEMPFALIHLPYIGKSYFLTREEAEKALEAMKDG